MPTDAPLAWGYSGLDIEPKTRGAASARTSAGLAADHTVVNGLENSKSVKLDDVDQPKEQAGARMRSPLAQLPMNLTDRA
ncbi:MAG: hypothetical protein OXP73_10770 [Chloroflexota bacterium]|nr:hypothetical protein [Chloroflexota bacterium]